MRNCMVSKGREPTFRVSVSGGGWREMTLSFSHRADSVAQRISDAQDHRDIRLDPYNVGSKARIRRS
jgi:hypothetical protein